jgi:hypothetical protein
MEIQNTIQKIINEINSDVITAQRKRYLESYMNELSAYLERHPNSTKLPTSLELFCDANPSAPECIKYDL